jgi:hypothetical protein
LDTAKNDFAGFEVNDDFVRFALKAKRAVEPRLPDFDQHLSERAALETSL